MDVAPAYSPNAAANGVTARAAYVDLTQTIQMILQKANEGRVDPAVRGWAGDVLIAAGRPYSNTDKMLALRRALQEATVFVPDPTGAEFIVGAAGTLCLRPGLCVRAGDCDDYAVVMLSAGNAIGIHCQLVKQHYRMGQPHVLIAYETVDGNGVYEYLDPTRNWSAGSAASAETEVWYDPLSAATPELVGVGAPPGERSAWIPHRQLVRDVQGWLEKDHEGWWRFTGAGWVPASYSPIAAKTVVGVGDAPNVAGSWLPIDNESQIVAGKRYYVAALTPMAHLDDALGDWIVDDSSVTPGDVTVGFARSFRFIGIAKVSAPKSSGDLQYLAIYQEVVGDPRNGGLPPSAPGGTVPASPPAPLANVPAPPSPIVPPPLNDSTAYVSASSVTTAAAVLALAGGVYWGIHRMNKKRKR